MFTALLENAHGPQLLEDFGLGLFAEWVVRVECGQLVCEAAQVTAYDVVFLVVEGALQVVARADGLFAVVVVGFVGVEVDFSEESGFLALVCCLQRKILFFFSKETNFFS